MCVPDNINTQNKLSTRPPPLAPWPPRSPPAPPPPPSFPPVPYGSCKLDVTQNDFGAAGGIAFGKALTVNRSLVALNLRFNRIGFGLERSVNVFTQSLALNTSLKWLDLAQNELGSLGGAALGEALKVRTSQSPILPSTSHFPNGASSLADQSHPRAS